ncbi:hypothetical protein MTAT_20960 [Moorella thermoacetica]|uniref:Uncharacterized protein n=1 Tax=Neomoorella thermoacetica TaxID=1525 RepID=A0AAC9MW36_NEOTH|nr:hypothetical protein Maut_02922 [Moorella thermoacetica]TYL11895.1 hypothetical protein MTAT_20960 [Moorella thermoacetica]
MAGDAIRDREVPCFFLTTAILQITFYQPLLTPSLSNIIHSLKLGCKCVYSIRAIMAAAWARVRGERGAKTPGAMPPMRPAA